MIFLTCREQGILRLYKRWDGLQNTQRFLKFCIFQASHKKKRAKIDSVLFIFHTKKREPYALSEITGIPLRKVRESVHYLIVEPLLNFL